VPPLVNQLVEHARVRVLRDEARAEQLKPLKRDLLDDGRVVEEPPAAERHQVRELPRRDAQLVLVLAREERDEEAHAGVRGAEPLDRAHVGPPEPVARRPQRRVHAAPHANHQRK
jgi:hypothetical protein